MLRFVGELLIAKIINPFIYSNLMKQILRALNYPSKSEISYLRVSGKD